MTPAAHAVLDVSALNMNLEVARSLAPRAKVMAVIKANGYGHGLLRIAKSLCHADAFAVARVDEGILLREAGIRQRISILEGFTRYEELELLRRYQLEPVVHAEPQIQIIESASAKDTLRIWLKLDSGMHRLGFYPQEYLSAYRRLNQCAIVHKPIALMTHLANADQLNDSTTEMQIEQFHQVTAGLQGQRSIANSAGILAWSNSHCDWVRPGLMLYGVSPFSGSSGIDHALKPVMTLQSRLLAVKQLQPGDAVGYGGEWTSSRTMSMGIVAIGYGDGYPRSVVTGTPVLINNIQVPIVGRVSMDMVTVDLSDCPDAKIGDPVVLWGGKLPVETVSSFAKTVPYTLLCGVTQRVRIIEEQQNSLVGRRSANVMAGEQWVK